MKAKAEFLIFLIIKDRMNFLVTCNGYHPMRNMYLEKAVGKIKRWKVTVEVGKFSILVGKLLLQLETYQPRSVLSNSRLSNLRRNHPTSRYPFFKNLALYFFPEMPMECMCDVEIHEISFANIHDCDS